MTDTFATPQDAEDAFYDAIDEGNFASLEAVWDDSEEILCLLPMGEVNAGRNSTLRSWQPLFEGAARIGIQVRHLHWIETDEIAIHMVEEVVTVPGQQSPQHPVYATNIYRKRANGWHMILHQNSPAPPPPGMVPPQMQMR